MKKTIIILISVITAFLILATAFLFMRGRGESGEGITRYEWIRMLTEEFNVTEARNDTPYFSDVPSDSPYFTAVQASCEWDVIDKAERFDGEKKITGKYAVLTAMRAVGAFRVKTYLDLNENPSEDDYLNLALEKQLIDKAQLSSNVRKEDAEIIIARARELYLSELWRDDYVEVKYAEGVRALESGDVIEYNAADHELKLSDNVLSGLSEGDIILFDDSQYVTKVSKKVECIKPDGRVVLTDASLDETLEQLVMSDIIPVSSDDILAGVKNLNGDKISAYSAPYSSPKGTVMPVWDVSGSYEGVAVDVKFTSDKAEITVTSHGTGESVTYGIPGSYLKNSKLDLIDGNGKDGAAVTAAGYAEVSLDLKNIALGVQTDYSVLDDFNYLAIQADCDFEPGIKVGGNVEAVLPIASVPLAGYGHLCGVMLDISLVVNLDGYAEFALEFTPQASFEYRKNAGTRYNMSVNLQKEDGNICASLEAQAQFAPTVYILGDNIADIELEAGAGASGEFTTRRKSNITMCADIDFYAPIASFGWLNGDGAYLAKWLPSGTISIYTSDNAPYRKKLHFERDKKGQWTLVPECTYKEGELEFLPTYYFGEFDTEFKKVKDHYEATGKLYIQAFVTDDDLKKAEVGSQLTCVNTTFTVTDVGYYDSKKTCKWYILDDKYLVGGMPNIYNPVDETKCYFIGAYHYSDSEFWEETFYDLEGICDVPGCPQSSPPELYILIDGEYDFITASSSIEDARTFSPNTSGPMNLFSGNLPNAKGGDWWFVTFDTDMKSKTYGKVLDFSGPDYMRTEEYREVIE